MKIEKLNENKLKITMDINDLKSRNIEIKTLSTNSAETQDLFWDVMQEAERQYGFDLSESMVNVEVSINSQGLFTMIVTKTIPPVRSQIKSKNKLPNLKLKRKELPVSLDNSWFEFKNLSSLRAFCQIANLTHYSSGKLYFYNDKYYMYIINAKDNKILDFTSRVQNNNHFNSNLEEYGKMLLKNDSLKLLKQHIKV